MNFSTISLLCHYVVIYVSVKVPFTMEIVLVPKKNVPAQYPGLYLFTNAARMMRPVMNLAANKIEYIGTFEQIYLNVCVIPEEAYEGVIYYFYIILFKNFVSFVILFIYKDFFYYYS